MDSHNISLPAKALIYLTVIIFTVLALYPIFWLVTQSFKTNMVYITTNKLSFPKDWYAGNYPLVWIRDKAFNYFVNSIIYAAVTVTAVVLLSNMAGYAFAKIRFNITKYLHRLFIMGILLTIQAILIPLYLAVNATGLYNTRLAVLFPYIALGTPMGIYLCTDFIKSIHDELLESARIDGAGYIKTFSSIVFPMSVPVSVTLAILTFTSSWNEFVLMNLLVMEENKGMPAAVGRYISSLGSDYGRLFTSLTVALIPILIFYAIFRNQITKGVAAGAVKG